MKACPILNPNEIISYEQKYYCAWNNNSRERHESTSGGAGSALATFARQSGFFVGGAGFDKNWRLRHSLSKEESVINSFKGSKYLKSDTIGVYQKVKALAKQGEKVLFTGTPCQCDALTHFLNVEEKENLITVSILCHGVNSPRVWNDYVCYIENQYHSELIDYNFRSKSKGWGEYKGGGEKLRVLKKFKNGRGDDVPSWNNIFHCWFGHHYILRPSCFSCPYRVKIRNSDITIGDFWGIRNVLQELDTKEGASVVITSTPKGEQFLHSCNNIQLIETDSQSTEKVLKGFIERRSKDNIANEIKKNIEFETEYLSKSFSDMAKKYPATSKWQHYLQAIKVRLHIGK